MKRRETWWIVMCLLVGSGCGDDEADSGAWYPAADGCPSSAAGRSAPSLDADDPLYRSTRPDNTTFCRIEMGVASEEDVVRVLGKPRFTYDAGRGMVSYTYDYAGGESVHLSFRDGRLHDADVANMPFPVCWVGTQMDRGAR